LRILIVHPPHPSIGSGIPDDPWSSLGLRSIAGPLLDAGHDVTLIDAEFTHVDRAHAGARRAACALMKVDEIAARIAQHCPDILILGHSSSTSANPIAIEIAALAKKAVDGLLVVYGGAYPIYHWRDVLEECPAIDLIVRGEGEETCRDLIAAISDGRAIEGVSGIAFRRGGRVHATSPRPKIQEREVYRMGWETGLPIENGG
jgi:anaerobic magnesium-protoporphyrin IX monomethyl ester cyclase